MTKSQHLPLNFIKISKIVATSEEIIDIIKLEYNILSLATPELETTSDVLG